jgi:hypothetical protein
MSAETIRDPNTGQLCDSESEFENKKQSKETVKENSDADKAKADRR